MKAKNPNRKEFYLKWFQRQLAPIVDVLALQHLLALIACINVNLVNMAHIGLVEEHLQIDKHLFHKDVLVHHPLETFGEELVLLEHSLRLLKQY